MKLYLVFYTDKFIPDGSRGCAKGPFIFIRPQCKEDEGLLAHEKEHVRQFWANPILHGLQYKLQIVKKQLLPQTFSLRILQSLSLPVLLPLLLLHC